jgi:low molecular weight protein-tyrosine phosphatase
MAEGYFVNQLGQSGSSQIIVTSAGIRAQLNRPAEPDAQSTMKKHGIEISAHRGRQLTEDLAKQSDLILVMTQNHLDLLTQQFPMAKGKTWLLGHWDNFEIADPYSEPHEAFETVFQLVVRAWPAWKTRIL